MHYPFDKRDLLLYGLYVGGFCSISPAGRIDDFSRYETKGFIRDGLWGTGSAWTSGTYYTGYYWCDDFVKDDLLWIQSGLLTNRPIARGRVYGRVVSFKGRKLHFLFQGMGSDNGL